jgi:predicted DNA binding CopG/RHH family protein
MNKKLKPIPEFKSEAAERAFWKAHDRSDYVDWSKARRVSFPNLKVSTRSISLRLPELLLERIRAQANKMDVPYQSLMKMWLSEKTSESEGARRTKHGSGG